MTRLLPEFSVEIASSDAAIQAAQRLRYDVFVTEMGASGDGVDHTSQRDVDRFDKFAQHLLLRDTSDAGAGAVVGVYRLMDAAAAQRAGGYYSEAEYDLTALKTSGRRLLELGRSCLRPAYRGGAGMYHLWRALADYVEAQKIDVLFGVASFPGTDPAKIAQPLAHLYQNHLAASDLRPASRKPVAMTHLVPDQIDRKAAMTATPPLIRAYLRLGGRVGDGAFIDHAFNTIDVCMVLDTQDMNARQRAFYARERQDV